MLERLPPDRRRRLRLRSGVGEEGGPVAAHHAITLVMSKILEAIDKLARQGHPPGWDNPAIKKFLETGDDALLKSIRPFRDGWTAWLTDALPDPDAWNDESTRLLTLAQAKGLRSLL